MSNKGIDVKECPIHGEYYLDAEDSPCPSCEEEEIDAEEEQRRDEKRGTYPDKWDIAN